MTEPNLEDFIISRDVEVELIDLDEEEVYLPDGRRLTEELAQEMAAQTLSERYGTPIEDERRRVAGEILRRDV